MPFKLGNWCLGCGKYDYEPAGEQCRNPIWHYGVQVDAREQEPDREDDD